MDENIFSREKSEKLDEILGEKFQVLNDGFIRVIDYLGNDNSVLMAARVSFGKGTRQVSSDKALINYLMSHHHWTPFEMPTIIFHVRVPMDAWRQWIRHRMGSFNEYSTRYSEAIDSMAVTAPNEWRRQSTDNKQGSSDYIDEGTGNDLSDKELFLHDTIKAIYKERLELGVAKEQARKDLPLSNYTEAYWKVDLRSLLNFLQLRTDSHAQKEIRDYANIILNEVLPLWVPYTNEAFLNFIKGAIYFSAEEQEILKSMMSGVYGFKLEFLEEKYGFIKIKENNEKIWTRKGIEYKNKISNLIGEIPYHWKDIK